MIPERPIETLEDQATRILSEILNDDAPLGEEFYRPAARRIIALAIAAIGRPAHQEAIEAVEEEVGFSAGGWDMVPPEEIAEAFRSFYLEQVGQAGLPEE